VFQILHNEVNSNKVGFTLKFLSDFIIQTT